MRVFHAAVRIAASALVFGPLFISALFHGLVGATAGQRAPGPGHGPNVAAPRTIPRVIDVGSGPPVVFLHGNPDNATEWHLVIDELSKTHRSLAFDLPGFGQATKLPKDYDFSVDSQTRFFGAALDELGLGSERFILVAHDIGAVMALAFAAEHPERLKGLVISNTAVVSDYHWHAMARIWSSPVLGELFMLGMNRGLFRDSFQKDSPTVPSPEAERIYDGISWGAKSSILQLYRVMTTPQYFEERSESFARATREVETIVVWGKRDAFIPVSFAHRIGGEVLMLEDAGHWVPLDAPLALADAVRKLTAL